MAVAARSLVGVKIRHQGRNPDVGLDCVGVVVASAALVGCPLPDIADYTIPAPEGRLRRELERCLDAYHGPLIPGVVLELADQLGDKVGSHLGILVTSSRMVHARREGLTVREVPFDDRFWARMVRGRWKLRGVA